MMYVPSGSESPSPLMIAWKEEIVSYTDVSIVSAGGNSVSKYLQANKSSAVS